MSPATANAQDLRAELFRETDEVWTTARAAHVEVLSPTSYAKAERLYSRAEDNLSRGRNIDDIRKDLREAVAHLHEGIEAAKAKGVYKGRKPSLDRRRIREMAEAGVSPFIVERFFSTKQRDTWFREFQLYMGEKYSTDEFAVKLKDLWEETADELITKHKYDQSTW